ncbi:hypothetical protein [Flavobacterium sp. FlaQc-50]|uniref:hypothetical protein n=1 Tax=unclassified Flavobacterium TaxID=196869 RepID=UPI003756FD98
MRDLFQYPDGLPQEVVEIFDQYDLSAVSFDDCEKMVVELEKIGYTFEYDLSTKPYHLMLIEIREKSSKNVIGLIDMRKDKDNNNISSPPLEIKTRDRITIVNHDINSIKKHR